MKGSRIDILEHPIRAERLSPAQWSNFFPLTPIIYEELWRVRALSILSGRPFPVEEEMERLAAALAAPASARGAILDAGCSTGLYARGVASRFPEARVTAVDISPGMLRAARRKAAAEGVRISLVRADLADLPFDDGSFDGICMGGTLNELGGSAEAALAGCRRILKPEGVFFNMHLLKAGSAAGSALQQALKLSGLRFWTRGESEALFAEAGFETRRIETAGVVCLSTLVPS